LVHGADATQGAIGAAEALFGRGQLDALDAATLAAAVAGLPQAVTGEPDPLVVDLFAAAGLERGKAAARRTLAEGGLYVNNVKISDPEARLTPADWLHGRYALLRRGRKTLAVAERSA
jgi:tyrosyl-tRNA synthetase